MDDKKPEVVIAGFGDEYSYHAEEHLKFLGERNIPISIRFFSFSDEARIDALAKHTGSVVEFKKVTGELKGKGIIKHITAATPDELQRYQDLMTKYGVKVWDIGSAVGKQYLGEADFRAVWWNTLDNTIRVAHEFETPRIRGFTFYPGTAEELKQADAEKFSELLEKYSQKASYYFDATGCILGGEDLDIIVEVESNLYGHDGESLHNFKEMSWLGDILMYFDGANMVVQDHKKEGLSFHTYNDMEDYLVGLHIKDAKYSEKAKDGAVDEEAAWPFVPVGQGDAQYDEVFKAFAKKIPDIKTRLRENELPEEVGVVLEPHLLCGGQFGGYTGERYPEAIKALTLMLDNAGIAYQPLKR